LDVTQCSLMEVYRRFGETHYRIIELRILEGSVLCNHRYENLRPNIITDKTAEFQSVLEYTVPTRFRVPSSRSAVPIYTKLPVRDLDRFQHEVLLLVV
jgi:hypothetical protein